MYKIPQLPLPLELETKAVLRAVVAANKKLAELKGYVHLIPQEDILINTLTLQEAKDSSEIENIVTTHDDLYKAEIAGSEFIPSLETKEVQNYAKALRIAFKQIRENKILSLRVIKEVQKNLEGNSAGFRSAPGTILKNNNGELVYTPPQDKQDVERYMANLEQFINNPDLSDLDPLIKMAIIHHQFESIHPFFDGNGRTGRIINILYLVINDLLDLPILYLSAYIIKYKTEYYRLIQLVRDEGKWEEWLLFILKGVELVATGTIHRVKAIASLMQSHKVKIRKISEGIYSHELLNNLFSHPYTKIDFLTEATGLSKKTAGKYLNILVDKGLLFKVKIWRNNYYFNTDLIEILKQPLI